MERFSRKMRLSYPLILRAMGEPVASLHPRHYHQPTHTTLPQSKGLVVDLRSDTMTKPTEGMKHAMMSALLGDDVYREDPTVSELERRMAECTGKDAALFVPSGTMGNLISVLGHCDQRGCEVLLGDQAHIFLYEQAGMAQLGGIQPNTIPTKPDGTFDASEILSRLRVDDVHCPKTCLICLENTQNVCGGKVLPLHWIDEVGQVAESMGVPIHMDGARLMNAAVASDDSPARILQACETASICFSKGLGTPVGSVIVGPEKFIVHKALRLRKVLGGGMRQAGMLAAAALYSMDYMVKRLAEDHTHAHLLATAISDEGSKAVSCQPGEVDTNIVIVHLETKFITPNQFCERLLMVNDGELREMGGESIQVKVLPWTDSSVRFVTHHDAPLTHIQAAVDKLKYVIREVDAQG